MIGYAVTAILAMDACVQCHPAIVRAHAGTLMAQTLDTEDAVKSKPPMAWDSGPYRYEVREGRYRVSDGRETFEAPIRWGIGQGDAGQTFVFEHDGKLFESRVSYYKKIGGLAFTLGAPSVPAKNLREAAGRELNAAAVAECFGCHGATTAGSQAVPRGTLAWTRTLLPGVQCGNCHKGGETHAARLTPMPKLGDLSAEEQSDLCGTCHRTWADIAANGPRGVANVRFQPYRIARAKCYDASDRRIACTACHDPHSRAKQTSASFDAACKNCHAGGCATAARQDCASCHMPKVELPGAHFRFADHWIRIVRNPNEYPD